MKELVVISGKGGTGKTSIVACFAALAPDALLADCDVDAADLHLILQPTVQETHDFIGGKRARIIPERCTNCGQCRALCRFGAIRQTAASDSAGLVIDPIRCEGCKVCVEFCSAGAILFEDAVNGKWFQSQSRLGPLIHAELGVAQENSGKLVSLIRTHARRLAEQQQRSLILVDGPPGIGCPVIASIGGASLVLIVTEPSLSGQHDMTRVARLTAHFKIPTAVCINKCDIEPALAARIRTSARQSGLAVLGQIPYDRAFTDAQIAGRSLVELAAGPTAEAIRALWQRTLALLSCQEGTRE